MELNSSIEEDIGRLNDSSFLSDKQYQKLLEKLFTLLTSSENQIELSSSFDKRVVCSILTLIFEFSKYDFDDDSIRSKLDELNLTEKSRQNCFVELYRKNSDVVQLYLRRNSTEHDRLLDLDWRLDMKLKSNYADKLLEPIYILNLTKRLKCSTEIERIPFTCSQENLQEFVEKLKDALCVLHQIQHKAQPAKK